LAKDKEAVQNEAKRIENEVAEKRASLRKERLDSYERQRQGLVNQGGETGTIGGRWLLDIPNDDKEREDSGYMGSDYVMDITAHQEGDAFIWGNFDIGIFEVRSKIHFGESSAQKDWQGREMKLEWVEDDEWEFDCKSPDDHLRVGSIMFRSATECLGSIMFGRVDSVSNFGGLKLATCLILRPVKVRRDMKN